MWMLEEVFGQVGSYEYVGNASIFLITNLGWPIKSLRQMFILKDYMPIFCQP